MDLRFTATFILRHLASLKRDKLSAKRLEKLTDRKLAETRAFAIQYSDFYKKHHKGLENAPLHELPPINKHMVMDNFDKFITDKNVKLHDLQKFIDDKKSSKLFHKKYHVLITSGSTGKPGIFIFNTREWAEISATFSKTVNWVGIKINPFKARKRVIVASTSEWHLSTQIGKTIKQLTLPVIKIPASQPIDKIVDTLNEYRPKELTLYASMAAILADEQIAKRLNIKPKSIITTSEVLTKESRKKIKKAWGINALNTYGVTEAGCIGGQCKAGNMHLLEDNSIFEVVDDDYKPVPDGKFGTKVLFTSLFHRTQPLIRYEISDSIKIAKKKCKCGKVYATIEDIQGRSEQIFHLQDKKGKDIKIHPVIFHEIMDSQPVKLWQVVKTPRGLEILVEKPNHKFSKTALLKDLNKSIHRMNAVAPKIEIKEVKAIEKEPSGKLPYIKVAS